MAGFASGSFQQLQIDQAIDLAPIEGLPYRLVISAWNASCRGAGGQWPKQAQAREGRWLRLAGSPDFATWNCDMQVV